MFLAPEIAIIIFVWIFGLIHSIFARDFIKEKLLIIRSYQRCYIIVALLTLVLLILIEMTLARFGTQIKVVINNPPIGILFLLIGGFFFFGGMLQLYLTEGLEKNQLIKTGFFAFARHPIYLVGIVVLTSLGSFFIANSVHISFLLSLSLYLFVGSLIEDYYLIRNVPNYSEYSVNCAKYFPWRKTHFQFLIRNIKLKKSK